MIITRMLTCDDIVSEVLGDSMGEVVCDVIDINIVPLVYKCNPFQFSWVLKVLCGLIPIIF